MSHARKTPVSHHRHTPTQRTSADPRPRRVLQDADGQVNLTHSVSAGLDYAAVGPEHSFYHDLKRIQYTSATDEEALSAFDLLAREEGIVPALESAHAIAEVVRLAPKMNKSQVIIANLSGRGDKDVNQVARIQGVAL